MCTTKSRILVTGGAGFIGSHVVPALLARGAKVTVFDDLTTGKLENLEEARKSPNFLLVRGDIRKHKELKGAFENVHAVVHLAAQIDVAKSVNNPGETHDINTTGTLNVLQAAAENQVENFVFASSTAVYGNTKRLPIREDTPLNPISPYAASKAASEAYCSAYSICYGIKTISLRFFNVYGKGNENNPYSGVITKFIQKALRDEYLTVDGDGKQTRDFIHINDVVNAVSLALDNTAIRHGIFNVCTGIPTSINQLVEGLGKVTQKNLQLTHAPKRIGDIRQSYGHPAKAAKELGFKSRVNLLQGLELMVKAFS